jgi:hypothetical protein
MVVSRTSFEDSAIIIGRQQNQRQLKYACWITIQRVPNDVIWSPIDVCDFDFDFDFERTRMNAWVYIWDLIGLQPTPVEAKAEDGLAGSGGRLKPNNILNK